MKKRNIVITFIIFCCFNSFVYAQWSAGASANFKKTKPDKGFGIEISRNLPYQFPIIGIKMRVDAGLFKQTLNQIDLSEKNINASIIASLFYDVVQPYFGIGLGYSLYRADDIHSSSLLLNFPAGLQLAALHPVYPFIEVKPVVYFNPADTPSGLKSVQYVGSAGIRIAF